jgi:hypothetical protein
MFHDGSLGNLDDGKSQGGRIACLPNKTGHSVASWIFWESRTIKRVCRSSLASEVLSAVEGYDATRWLLALWKEISGQDLDALLVTDSESLQQKACRRLCGRRNGFGSTWLCFVKVFVVENTAWRGRVRRATWRIH